MIYKIADKEALLAALERLEPGDCVELADFGSAAGGALELLAAINAVADKGADLISRREELDTRGEQGQAVLRLCRALAALERSHQQEKQRRGIEKAREAGKYKGRKPILVDEALFEDIAGLWKNGQITARQAMSRLELKPNTFYRRIRDWEAARLRKAGQELKTELTKERHHIK